MAFIHLFDLVLKFEYTFMVRFDYNTVPSKCQINSINLYILVGQAKHTKMQRLFRYILTIKEAVLAQD